MHPRCTSRVLLCSSLRACRVSDLARQVERKARQPAERVPNRRAPWCTAAREIGAAWGVKERLRMLLACTDLDTADTACGLLGINVVAADLPEARRLWETINDRWDEIETFIETRVTNARTEAANTAIKHIRRTRGTWHLSTNSEPDFVVAPLEIRSIFPQELPLLVSLGGLRLVERFGDWSGRPFAGDTPLHSASASPRDRRLEHSLGRADSPWRTTRIPHC